MAYCIHCLKQIEEVNFSEHFQIHHIPNFEIGTEIEIMGDIEIRGVSLKRGMKGRVVDDPYCVCDHTIEESLKIEGINGYLGVPFDAFKIVNPKAVQ